MAFVQFSARRTSGSLILDEVPSSYRKLRRHRRQQKCVRFKGSGSLRASRNASDGTKDCSDIAGLWKEANCSPSWTHSSFSLNTTANGRGVVVKPGSHVSAGEPIISIPLKSAVTADEATIGICCDTHLALLLLNELNKPGSLFSKYGSYLPKCIDSASLWNERELSELQCEQVAESARSIQEHIEAQYEELDFLPEAFQHLTTTEGFTLEDFRWAMSMVHSRSFALTTPAGRRLRCIIPFADMCNHGTDGTLQEPGKGPSMTHSWGIAGSNVISGATDDMEATFNVMASHTLVEGQEVLISYGQKKNADLLVEYGFVLTDNAWDCAVIYDTVVDLIDDDEFRPPSDSLKDRMQKEEIVHMAVPPMHYLAVRPGGDFQQVLGLLRVLYAHPDDMELLESVADEREGYDIFMWTSEALIQNCRVMEAEIESLAHLERRCKEILNDFPTSCSEDEEILRALADRHDYNAASRFRMAVVFRLESKKLLQDALDRAMGLSAQIEARRSSILVANTAA